MKVVAIARGLKGDRIREQPWCYIHRVWKHLPDHGIEGAIISDGYPRLPRYEELDGVDVYRVRTVRSLSGLKHAPLQTMLRSERPDVLLWNVGLTSLVHLAITAPNEMPVVGLFTSPIYRLSEILRMGPRRVAYNFRDLYVHLLGAALPRALVSYALGRAFVTLIVLTRTAKEGLTSLGVPASHIQVVPPGVDDVWLDAPIDAKQAAQLRRKAGLDEGSFLVLYLGGPSFLRGPDILIRAVALARNRTPQIRLVLLCRRWPNEGAADEHRLRQLIRDLGQDSAVQLVSGYLPEEGVRHWVGAADLVALPFRLVPSEAPLSLLEAAAAGRPIVSSSIDGIPSLLPSGAVRLVPPGDVQALAQAILEVASHADGSGSAQHRYWHRGWRDVAADVATVLREVAKGG